MFVCLWCSLCVRAFAVLLLSCVVVVVSMNCFWMRSIVLFSVLCHPVCLLCLLGGGFF